MSKFDEMIIVVPRQKIFLNEKNQFDGFLSYEEDQAKEIFQTLKEYEIKRRGDMEEDPAYKQLISYCILENENEEILVYERLSGGGEERLHGLSSIGVGGHMNDIEYTIDIKTITKVNAERELEEEVGLNSDEINDLELIGFINDDQNEVGKVHIGVVYKLKVDKDKVKTIETDTLKIDWLDKQQLTEQRNYETWSKLIIEGIYKRGE